MQPRGQAALEFLMTYGWAFLVMTAVIAGLFALDPLGSEPVIQRCSTTGLASCDQDKVYASQDAEALILPLSNERSEAVTVADISLDAVNDEDADVPCTDRARTLQPGETAEIVCHGDNLSLTPGQTNRFTATYETAKAEVGQTYATPNHLSGAVTLNTPEPPGPSLTAPSDLAAVHDGMEGSGTSSDPYKITSVPELRAIQEDRDAHYEIVRDIDASRTKFWNGGFGFTPIGSFSGVLDGNGHTIADLTVDRPGFRATLFQANDGDIANLTLRRQGLTGKAVSGVTHDNTGQIMNIVSLDAQLNGSNRATGIAAHNFNRITDVRVNAELRAKDARAVGGVTSRQRGGIIDGADIHVDTHTGGARWVGGVAGRNGGQITESHVTGVLNGSYSQIGGIAGGNSEVVTETFTSVEIDSSASRAGGIVGSNQGSINSSYSLGSIQGTGRHNVPIAGIFDDIHDSYTAMEARSDNDVIIGFSYDGDPLSDTYYDTEETGITRANTSWRTGLTTNQMKGESARTHMSGLDFNNTWETVRGEYPILQAIPRDEQLSAR